MRRTSYDVMVWRPDGSSFSYGLNTSDARNALRLARKGLPEAVAVEVRGQGSPTVVACWGDRARFTTCAQCGHDVARRTA